MYEAILSCSPTLTYMSSPEEQHEHILSQQHTGIVDSGATHLYIAPSAPYSPPDTSAATISVGTANGQVEESSATATLTIPHLGADFPTTGYIMSSFTKTLIGVGPIYDADCTVVFAKKEVTVLSPKGKEILTGWREKNLPRIWRFALKPTEQLINYYTTTIQTTLAEHSACNLPSVDALVQYMHAAAEFPVIYTWLKAIKMKLCDMARIDIL